MEANTKTRRWFRREPVEDRALTRESLPSVMLPTTVAGPPLTARSALSVCDAWACVRVLAESAATLPLHVFRRTEAGRVHVDDSTAARLLDRPAPGVTQANLIAQLVTHVALWGEAFLAIYRDEQGQVAQLGLFAPDRVAVEVIGGLPTYGITTDDGRYLVLGTSDVVHVRGMSLDGVRGLSPVAQQREALGYATALARHGQDFMANGARPSGVLYVSPGVHADEQIENLKAAWESRHRGSENAGRVALLTGEAKFEAVSMPLADAEFISQREMSTREVARIFRVPLSLLGAPGADSLTYSTVLDELRRFVVLSLRPLLVFIEQALAASVLFPVERREYPLFDLEGLLRGDSKQRAEFYTAALDPVTGWMRRDEARDLEDLPAEDPESRPPPPEPRVRQVVRDENNLITAIEEPHA